MANLATVKEKVQQYLAANFRAELTENGGFTLRHESARLFININQRKDAPDGPVFIGFLAPVLHGVAPSPALFEHVALHADDYILGHMSAFRQDDGSISLFFTHTILGDFLDEEEFNGAVFAVLGTANDLDDELQKQFGGTRFHEDS